MENNGYMEEEELLEQIIARPNQASRAGLLIVKLNKLIKKPEIDSQLSEVLSEYLGQLATSQVYLNNDIFNTNFSEGALLIQSACALYSKKVDMLWDSVINYAERMVQYEKETPEKAIEFEKVQERKQRFKRKRAVQVETEKPQNNVDVLQDMMDVQLEVDTEMLELLQNPELISDHQHKFNTNFTLLEIYKRNQVDMTDTGPVKCNHILQNSLNHFLREELANCDIETLCNIDRTSFTSVWNASDDLIFFDKMYALETEIEPHNYFEHVINFLILVRGLSIEYIYDNIDLVFRDFELLCQKHAKRGSKAKWRGIPEELIPEQQESSDDGEANNESFPNEVEIINNNANSPPRKTCGSDIDSGYELSLSRHSNTPFQLMSPIPEESEKSQHNENETLTKTSIEPETHQKNEEQILSSINIQPIDDYNNFLKPLERSPSVISNNNEDELCCHLRKKRRRNSIMDTSTPKRERVKRLRLRPIITTTLNKFNDFFFNNYQPEEGEGVLVEPPVFETEDDNMETTDVTDTIDRCADIDLSNNSGFDTGYETQNASDVSNGNSQETNFKETNTGFDKNNSESNLNSSKDIKDQDQVAEINEVELRSTRYIEWRAFINSKIINQNENDFDIHEEGGRIIERIGEIGTKTSFKNICGGNSAASISRTFISMLQLANNSNVEILSQGFGVANDTLELKLLSKVQNFEAVNRFEAPSELDIRMRSIMLKIPNVQSRKRVPGFGNECSVSKKGKF